MKNVFVKNEKLNDYDEMSLCGCLGYSHDILGPSPRIKKWSGGENHGVPTAREGDLPLWLGGLPREIFEF